MRGVKQMEALVAFAAAKVGGDEVGMTRFLRLAVELAQEANRLPGLKGAQRLELVVGALRKVLELPEVKARVPEGSAAALEAAIETVVPGTIALVIEASRGGFVLKKPSVGCVAALAAALCRRAAAAAPALAPVAAVAEAVAAAVPEEPSEAPAASAEPAPAAPTEERPAEQASPATPDEQKPAESA
jgi:hypothetical protein